MKVFALKIFLFLFLFIVSTSFLFRFYSPLIPGPLQHVYLSIVKSTVKKKVKKLILGDSCGEQLYNNKEHNGSVYSLACNQAITLAGNYILLNNFIRANLDQLPGEVILIMDINSFLNNLDQPYTYNYFLKPFYVPENLKYFTSKTLKILQTIPFHQISQWPLIKTSVWCPEFIPMAVNNKIPCFSDLSGEYLFRMNRLCERYGIKFRIFPSIMSDSRRQSFQTFLRSVRTGWVSIPGLFENYQTVGAFMPDSCFSDAVHLKKAYILSDYYHFYPEQDNLQKAL
ncbi:MAG: hypothetical protein WCI71_10635 [Bacteroidota bacterium]